MALAVISIASFAAMAVYVYVGILDDYAARDAAELRGKAELVRHIVEEAGTAARLDHEAHRLRDIVMGHRGLRLFLQDASGRRLLAVPEEDPPPLFKGAGPPRAEPVETLLAREGGREVRYRALQGRIPVEDGDVMFTLLLDVSGEVPLVQGHLRSIVAAALVGIVLSVLLGVLVVRRNLTPLYAISAAARKVSASHLTADLPTAGLPRELRPLADAFNDMLGSLRQSFERLSDFAADLAHELRTPVANMQGLAQVTLSKARSADEYRLVVESNLEECERLARTIGDMLLLARMDRHSEPLNWSRFDVAEEARRVAQIFEPLLLEQRIAISVAGKAEISADRDMVRRALSNLVANAIAHGGGDDRVDVEVRAAGARVEIVVRNRGRPIPVQHLPRLFDRFYRVDPGRDREGSGLGLAIVKAIAEAHGGSVGVTSDAIRGTEVLLWLPSEQPTAAVPGAAA
jgi:two-component system heavy metal sensor histidine kinase CusS